MTAEILSEKKIAYKITSFSTAKTLWESLCESPTRFDILLLDIMLDTENGMELAKLLRQAGNEVSILFVTSSPDFSLEGYSVFPVHYLLKPVRKEQLAEALERDHGRNRPPQSILFPIKGGSASVQLNEILYIEILNRQVHVQTINRRIKTACPTLSKAGALVPESDFLQCHKSFLIHIKNIRDVTKSGILLSNGETVPVGRAHYQAVLQAFIDFIATK